MKNDAIGRSVVNWRQRQGVFIGTAVSAGVQHGYVIMTHTTTAAFSRRICQRDSCRDYISTPAVVAISVLLYPASQQRVRCVATGNLVCNKRKSVLTESALTVLSHTEINRDSAGIRTKVCITRVSVITESVITKFYSSSADICIIVCYLRFFYESLGL